MTNLHMLVEDRKILIQALAQYGVPSARENVLVGSCKLGAVTAQYR